MGLFAFDVPGRQYDRDWLHVGMGVDRKIGKGTVSVMLNVTTRSTAPSYRLTASYRAEF